MTPWAAVSLELDLNSFCRPISIQDSTQKNCCLNMVPLVTAAHAGNSSLCHPFSEASNVPRTSITRRSHQCASICPLLGSPSVKPFLCSPLPLPFLVKDWSFDCLSLPELCPLLLPLGEMFCCLFLPQPLSDFFRLPNARCFGMSVALAYSCGRVYLSPRFRKRPDVFLSSSLQLAPPTMIRCGLGKSCTSLR